MYNIEKIENSTIFRVGEKCFLTENEAENHLEYLRILELKIGVVESLKRLYYDVESVSDTELKATKQIASLFVDVRLRKDTLSFIAYSGHLSNNVRYNITLKIPNKDAFDCFMYMLKL